MIKVLIVDDHQMMIDGWKVIMDDSDKFKVVGSVNNGADVLKFIRRNEIDLVIMDIDLGDASSDGIVTTRAIRSEFGDAIKILIVSMHSELGYIQAAMEAGTNGYILKTASSDEMLQAMRRIMDGKSYYSQDVSEQIAVKMRLAGEMAGIKLTKREKEALPLICKGLTAKQIGKTMNITENTANFFKKRLFIKFEVNSSGKLMHKARQLGFVR